MPEQNPLLVADSFRLQIGNAGPEVLDLPAHLARFKADVLRFIAAANGSGDTAAKGSDNSEADSASNTSVAAVDSGAKNPAWHQTAAILEAELNEFIASIPTQLAALSSPAFPRIEAHINEAELNNSKLHGATAQAKAQPLANLSGQIITYNLNIRPLPELKSSMQIVGLAASTAKHAGVKGPNILAYQELNTNASGEVLLHTANHEADSAVSGNTATDSTASSGPGADITSSEHALETTTSALLWWRGDTLCFVAPKQQAAPKSDSEAAPKAQTRVASVTERVVLEIATELGFAVAAANLSLAEIPTRIVWSVNALHGLRPVTHFLGAELPATKLDLLAKFQDALEARYRPVLAPAQLP